MPFYQDFPIITVTGRGLDADKPAKAESHQHAYYAYDTNVLYFADLNLNWVDSSGGAGGTPDDEEIILSFSYNDTFPLSVYTFATQGSITRSTIFIDTVFDGTGGFTVGYAGFTDRVMEQTDIAVDAIGAYQVPENLLLPITTDIQVYSNLVGTTQGDATILLNISR